jgi:hypothetical protein
MTVTAVVSGLLQLAESSSAAIRASTILQNVGLDPQQASQWASPKGSLRELNDLLGHYATDGDDEMARAILRYGRGDRSFATRFLIGPPQDLDTQLQGLSITPSVAESFSRLVAAVDDAQPRMFHLQPTRYIRGREPDGDIRWGEVPYEYRFSERPVSYQQFLPLAEAMGFPMPHRPNAFITMGDPILNVPNGLMDHWIAMLRTFSGMNYRLPTEPEWERATAMNHSVVSLSKEARKRRKTADELIQGDWEARYANGYVGERNGLGIGGEILNDASAVQRLLREGLAVSAWDFAQMDDEVKPGENIYERLTLEDFETAHRSRVGLKYFTHRKALRKKGRDLLQDEGVVFRLAVGGPSRPTQKPRASK